MFTIKMYQFNKRINSTKRPTAAGDSFSCEMKESSSILFPVVEIRTGNDNSIIPLYNYAYISEFNRYYWIDDIVYDMGYWTISMHCDALASFQYDILHSSQYVVRSASESDNDIADTMYLSKLASYSTEYEEMAYNGIGGDVSKVYAKNPNGSYTSEDYFNQSFTSGYFVIGVVGNNTAGVTYYSMSNNSFKNFIQNAFTLTPSDMNDVSSGVANAIFNPMQYITSAKWFPIEPYYSGTTSSIKVGGYTIPGSYTAGVLTATDIKTVMMNITLPKHPSGKKWMNLSPFTELNLVFQPFGVIPLDTTKLINSEKLVVHVAIDFCGGMCTLNLYREDTGETIPFNPDGLLYSVSTDYGVSLPVSTLVMDWKAGAIVSTMQFLKSAVMENPFKKETTAAPTRRSAGTSSGPGITRRNLPERTQTDSVSAVDLLDKAMDLTASALGQVSSTGAVGSFLAYMSNVPYIMAWFKNIVEEDNMKFGRPLNRIRPLFALSGFCVCLNAVVNFTTGKPMQEEVATIQSVLNSGVFLEE